MTPLYLWPPESRIVSLIEEPPFKRARREAVPSKSVNRLTTYFKMSLMTHWLDAPHQNRSNTDYKAALIQTTEKLTQDLYLRGMYEEPKPVDWIANVISEIVNPIVERTRECDALSYWLAQNTSVSGSKESELEGVIPSLELLFKNIIFFAKFPSIQLKLLSRFQMYDINSDKICQIVHITEIAKALHKKINIDAPSILNLIKDDKKIQNNIISKLDHASKLSFRATSKDSYKATSCTLIDAINASHLHLKFKDNPVQAHMQLFREYSDLLQVIDIRTHLLSDSLYSELVENFPMIKKLIAKIRKLPEDGFKSLEHLEALTMVVDEETEYHNLAAPKLKYLEIVGDPIFSMSSIEKTLNCTSLYFKNSYAIHQVSQEGNTIFDGRATLILPNRTQFQGLFMNSRPMGFCNAAFYFDDHRVQYFGNVTNWRPDTNVDINNQPIKEGCRLIFENGALFIGSYKEGIPVGIGSIVYQDGSRFIGEFNGFSKCPGRYHSIKGGMQEGLFSFYPNGNIKPEFIYKVLKQRNQIINQSTKEI